MIFFALHKNNFPSQNLSCGHIRRNEIFELKFTSEKFHRRVGVFAFFRSGCRREQSSRLFGTPCSPSTRSRRTVVVFFPCNVDDESVDFREPANKSNWRHPDGVLHRHKIRLMNWLVVRGSTFFSSLHDVVYFFFGTCVARTFSQTHYFFSSCRRQQRREPDDRLIHVCASLILRRTNTWIRVPAWVLIVDASMENFNTPSIERFLRNKVNYGAEISCDQNSALHDQIRNRKMCSTTEAASRAEIVWSGFGFKLWGLRTVNHIVRWGFVGFMVGKFSMRRSWHHKQTRGPRALVGDGERRKVGKTLT